MRFRFLFVLTFCTIGFGQSLDDQDVTLGLNNHRAIVSQIAVIPQGEVVSLVTGVWQNMVNTPSYRGSAVAPSLFVLDTSTVNAFSAGGGQLYVHRGLVEAVHGNTGILAFVIGHEMAHNRMQHGIHRYLRAAQFNYDIRLAYSRNTWAGIALEVADRILESKMERDEEHEADRMGLLMAAEAGYHPDFAVLAARELRMTTGDSSKFAAFFQGHPRWTTREQRAEGIRDQAIQVFNSRWPNVVLSPGGEPPTMVTIDDVQVVKDKKQKGVFHISFMSDARNVKANPVKITAMIARDKPSEPVIMDQESFSVSQERQWNLTLDKAPKDKLGKRYLQVTATMNGKTLFEAQYKKID